VQITKNKVVLTAQINKKLR